MATLPHKAPHFDRAGLPPARTFYERELGRLSRPIRGWAKGNCPFHPSKSGFSFSVHLDSGNFYCFGCNEKGDMISFLMKRDHLSFKDAAKSLGAWREDMTPAETQRLQRIQQERERHRLEQERQKELEIAQRRSVLAELHAAQTLYREACEEHDIDLAADLIDRVRHLEEWYCRLAGLETAYSVGNIDLSVDLGISPTAQEIGFSSPSRRSLRE